MGDLDIVCFPGTLFDKAPQTNRQRVMTELQKRGNRVYYIEPLKNPFIQLAKWILGVKKEQKNHLWFKRIFQFEKRLGQLWIGSMIKILPLKNPKIRRISHFLNAVHLKMKLKKMNVTKPILWIYTPDAVDFIDWIDHKLVIYDCVDEYSAQPWYAEEFGSIIESENKLLRRADLVFTSAEFLYDLKKMQNNKTYLLENVAEFDHFNRVLTEELERPSDIKSISGPILGFIGALDKYKLDYSAIIRLAQEKKDCNVVLIGPHSEAEKSTNLDDLKKVENIFILGPRDYEVLPNYIAAFDVCLIPYNENEYTKGCFPLKFFEYLATGKPVVTLGLPTLKKFSQYRVYAETFNEFRELVNVHLNNQSNHDQLQIRVKLAKENTWSTKVDKMEKIIDENTSLQTSIGQPYPLVPLRSVEK
ncbi:glycosyltransferase [Paenibacillus sp. B01]|uniref:glycosyltransferase n=1 Tax=Paenibacillus sp. B01 TaxID=2660554 RepID=UPI00129AABA3|nr:glycosyltransferase [Paenibacillus sp. B01]QGG55276.1 glycosyltransferase [Paenibacillus sp. B01]